VTANADGGSTYQGPWIPARVMLCDYPELKRLAWHVVASLDVV
jgi:hypothetical protein